MARSPKTTDASEAPSADAAEAAAKAKAREELFNLLSDNFGDIRAQVKATRKFGPKPGKLILDSLSDWLAEAPNRFEVDKILEYRRRAEARLEALAAVLDKTEEPKDRATVAAAAASYVATQASCAAMAACRAFDPSVKIEAARAKVRQRIQAAVGAL